MFKVFSFRVASVVPLGYSSVIHICVCMYACCVLSCFSHVHLVATPWAVALQASLSMGLPRQEYRSGMPYPPPGDLPDPGIKPSVSPASQADSLLVSHGGSLWVCLCVCVCVCIYIYIHTHRESVCIHIYQMCIYIYIYIYVYVFVIIVLSLNCIHLFCGLMDCM